MHNDMAHLALYIVKSSDAVDMEDYSVYQIKGAVTGNVLRITLSSVFKSNLHIESRPMIINPTPLTVDEHLHKIGLDSSRCV